MFAGSGSKKTNTEAKREFIPKIRYGNGSQTSTRKRFICGDINEPILPTPDTKKTKVLRILVG